MIAFFAVLGSLAFLMSALLGSSLAHRVGHQRAIAEGAEEEAAEGVILVDAVKFERIE